MRGDGLVGIVVCVYKYFVIKPKNEGRMPGPDFDWGAALCVRAYFECGKVTLLCSEKVIKCLMRFVYCFQWKNKILLFQQ